MFVKMINRSVVLIFVLLLIVLWQSEGCSLVRQKTTNPILSQLDKVRGRGILFGHQDDLAYGVGWKYLKGESDVKRVSGDYPALFGWELGGLELGHDVNLDSVPFHKIKHYVQWVNAHGGINTFSWHPYSPVDSVNAWHGDSVVVPSILPGGAFSSQFQHQLDLLAAFLKQLKDSDGQPIPFIFRPWHEMDGNWFWWGAKACTPDEFKTLFRFTVTYLRHKGLSNMLIAYSPDRNFKTVAKYETWYPGDDVVDILGMDNYYDLRKPDGVKTAVEKLRLVIDVARQKGKPAALTETGSECIPDSTWYPATLGTVLNDSLIRNYLSYVMVWRNASIKQFFFPYPGNPAASGARKLLKNPPILLLNDFNQLKNN